MEMSRHDIVFHGAVGGVFAGAIIALWFLVVDLAAGVPFATPIELSWALLGTERDAGLGVVALYTVLHFGVFAILGMISAWFLGVMGVAPGWGVGLVFGIGILNAVHYSSLLITGADAVTVLSWQHVVGANLVAGLGLMTYLHGATRERRPLGFAVLRGHPVITQGILTGMVGAGVVALWFFLLDIAGGDPFRTPASLGSILFLGATGPDEVQVDVGIVAGYTIVHLLAFGAIGIVFVGVARQIERIPGLAYLVALAFIVLEAVSFGALVSLGNWVIGDLSLWTIGTGNLLAIAAMAWFVWRHRSTLRERLVEGGWSSAA